MLFPFISICLLKSLLLVLVLRKYNFSKIFNFFVRSGFYAYQTLLLKHLNIYKKKIKEGYIAFLFFA